MAHLHPGIRVAALRRRMWVDTYENDYGQYWQELADPGSGLHKFKPTAILFALDAYHLASGVDAGYSGAAVETALAAICDPARGAAAALAERHHVPLVDYAEALRSTALDAVARDYFARSLLRTVSHKKR